MMTIFIITKEQFGHHRLDDDHFYNYQGAIWSSSLTHQIPE
ncbi:hypothetical protein [Ammoniphilus resinae]|nr:hypothetical protein [Ammoniphilus resinae]